MSFNMGMGYPLEAEIAKREKWPILIPIGTMEYHSAHCPYGCDTLISMGIAEKIAEKIDAVIFPPIWYGVSSYAVCGPEKNTIQVNCDVFEDYIYCILKSLFEAGFNRNIFLVISHQTEDYLPMELACLKAAKKLTFEYLEEHQGYGWWGNNKNKDFYENVSRNDNPWNWVRVITGDGRNPGNDFETIEMDHAGKYESAMLEYLYPGLVKLERLADCEDWFSKNAGEMTSKMGEQMVKRCVDEHVKYINGEEKV